MITRLYFPVMVIWPTFVDISTKLLIRRYIFGARDHLGKELVDARTKGVIKDILFVEDFEYRLNLKRAV